MAWAKTSAKNILPLSSEKSRLDIAIREWIYQGNMYDLEEPSEECELCEHPEIRYQFEIINTITRNTMLVGSECINKFEISATNDSGEILSSDESRKKVNRDRGKLIKDAHKRSLIQTLIALSKLDVDLKIDSFINYYQEREAFTPAQVSILVWKLRKFKIPYRETDFKVTLRRNREKEQLLSMSEWKVKQIIGTLSSAQAKWYARNKSKDDD